MLVVAMLAAGYCLFLPRDALRRAFFGDRVEPRRPLMSAKVASDGQWRFFPRTASPKSSGSPSRPTRTNVFTAISGWIRWRWGVPCGRTLRPGGHERGEYAHHADIRLSRGGKPRTFREKFVEMVLATRLELRCSKDEILALYASHAPFGGNVVGLESAAW